MEGAAPTLKQYLIKFIYETMGAEQAAITMDTVTGKATASQDGYNKSRARGTEVARGGLRLSEQQISSYTTLGKEEGKLKQIMGQLNLSSKDHGKVVDSNVRLYQDNADTMAKYSYTVEDSVGKQTKLTGTFNQSKHEMKENSAVMQTATTQTKKHGNSITDLAKRAAFTIPIWYALRQAINTVITTLKEGLADIKAIDTELQRLQLTLGGAITAPAVLDIVENRAKELALETGKSVGEIIRAFYQFKTLGMDVETSMAGMEVATKGAVAMMSDLVPLSQILARSYNLLGHTMDKNASITENMQASLGKLVALFENNDFVLNQFGESMDKFLATANTMNLTYDEMITYLASLHSGVVQGSRAGRLFRTTLMQLVNNLDQVGEVLGLRVIPNVETTSEMFDRVLKKLQELKNIGDMSATNRGLQGIFGGVRGGEVARTLLAVLGMWEQNTELIKGMGTEAFIEKFTKSYEDAQKRIVTASAKVNQARINMGRSFVGGFTGGEEFAKTLEKISDLINNSVVAVGLLGAGFKRILVMATILTAAQIPKMATMLGNMAKIKILPFVSAFGGITAAIYGISELVGWMIKLRIESEKAQTNKLNVQTQGFKDTEFGFNIGTLTEKELDQKIAVLEAKQNKYKETAASFEAYQRESRGSTLPSSETKKSVNKELSMELKIEMIWLQKFYKMKADYSISEDGMEAEMTARRIEHFRKIDAAAQKEIETIKQKQKYIKMEIQGYSELEVAHQTSIDYLQNLINEQEKLDPGGNEKVRLKAITAVNLLEAIRLGQYEQLRNVTADEVKFKEQLLEITKLVATEDEIRLKKLLSYTEKVRTAVSGSMSDLFSGKLDISEFASDLGNKFGEMFRKGVSDAMTNELLNLTGLDTLFGNMFTQIENAHVDGIGKGVDKLRQFYDEKSGIGTVSNTTSGGGVATTPSGVYRAATKLPFMSRTISNSDLPTQYTTDNKGKLVKTGAGLNKLTYGNAATLLGSTMMGVQSGGGGIGSVLGGLGGLGMGIGTLQAGAVAGTLFGGSAAATATTGAVSAGLLSASFIPMLGLALVAASMLIPKKSSNTQTTETTKNTQIAPKIDVTNKNLEIINRNLVAMRTDMRTFVLAGSAYWSTKNTLEDNFSLHSRMGILN